VTVTERGFEEVDEERVSDLASAALETIR